MVLGMTVTWGLRTVESYPIMVLEAEAQGSLVTGLRSLGRGQ